MTKESLVDRILNDVDKKRIIDIEFYGENYTIEYKILGNEYEKIQEKYLDSKNLDKTALKAQRRITWAMLAKANPEEFAQDVYNKFPTELLDIISTKIMGVERDTAEDFREPSDEESGTTT